eukprot:729275-Prymnesium_polylepis.1
MLRLAAARGLFGVLCGCVLPARAHVHRAWYCARLEAAMAYADARPWPALGLLGCVRASTPR